MWRCDEKLVLQSKGEGWASARAGVKGLGVPGPVPESQLSWEGAWLGTAAKLGWE